MSSGAVAVVIEGPERLALERLALDAPTDADVVVDIAWSGISTGTEKLLWSGRMPPFPGMGYPLVPGYESVGRVVEAGRGSGHAVGDTVFVPGARCFGPVRGLFGGAASRLVADGSRVVAVDPALGADAVLLALAATAYHAVAGEARHGGSIMPPDLIVGHGVLGRLLARMTVAAGFAPPVVWERDAARRAGAAGYAVVDPEADARRDYRAVYDVSGDAGLLDTLIGRLAPGGEVVLAGFYADRLSFSFPPMFMREARIRAAAEWQKPDLLAVRELVQSGRVSLDGLVTHRAGAADAVTAYPRAFGDAGCLKMILDWEGTA